MRMSGRECPHLGACQVHEAQLGKAAGGDVALGLRALDAEREHLPPSARRPREGRLPVRTEWERLLRSFMAVGLVWRFLAPRISRA